ncbi:MAG: glycosyltransferase [Bacteroidia bacterium]|nr:glycosyltransferase [Bacteroidia bacterium]
MKQTLVSVIITCYNYEDYIKEAIESVLNQTHNNIEFIIIDDGSTDDSLKIIKKYADKAKIVSRKNKGIVYTRNEALELAQGDYICFLDADDYFNKDYIEKSVELAEKYNSDVVYPNWRIFGDDNYTMTFPEFDIQKLIRQEIHCTSESLIRRSAVGNHRFESEEVAEDWDFFLGLALDGRIFKLAKDCYINYRVRRGTRGAKRSYWDDMYYFCDILSKWSKIYPEQVNPFDLPITAGKNKDHHIDILTNSIKDKDNIIENLTNIIQVKDNKITDLQYVVGKIRKSRSYRLGNVITLSIRKGKNLVKKILLLTK